MNKEDYMIYGLIIVAILTIVTIAINSIMFISIKNLIDKNTDLVPSSKKNIKRLYIPSIVLSVIVILSHIIVLYFSFKSTFAEKKLISWVEIFVLVFTLAIVISFIMNMIRYKKVKDENLLE